MRIRLSLVLFVLALFAAAWGLSVASGLAAGAQQRNDEVAREVIARERASFDAWQRKDKAFFAGFMADDATYFGMMNPYLETNPKENFLPKFEQITEMFKMLDFQMYNPRVQVYGDTAVLTYNAASVVNMGGRTMHYTSKMTSVYVRQNGVWRVVHGHESMNPGSQ
ncbi:MAG TPA: nuclear transport factor 2 family protein [Pyrinomonadaceae bacterium]|nr:nuclear transport factor 2 family protein [Pyrinomonadaceae bacterium]